MPRTFVEFDIDGRETEDSVDKIFSKVCEEVWQLHKQNLITAEKLMIFDTSHKPYSSEESLREFMKTASVPRGTIIAHRYFISKEQEVFLQTRDLQKKLREKSVDAILLAKTKLQGLINTFFVNQEFISCNFCRSSFNALNFQKSNQLIFEKNWHQILMEESSSLLWGCPMCNKTMLSEGELLQFKSIKQNIQEALCDNNKCLAEATFLNHIETKRIFWKIGGWIETEKEFSVKNFAS